MSRSSGECIYQNCLVGVSVARGQDGVVMGVTGRVTVLWTRVTTTLAPSCLCALEPEKGIEPFPSTYEAAWTPCPLRHGRRLTHRTVYKTAIDLSSVDCDYPLTAAPRMDSLAYIPDCHPLFPRSRPCHDSLGSGARCGLGGASFASTHYTMVSIYVIAR